MELPLYSELESFEKKSGVIFFSISSERPLTKLYMCFKMYASPNSYDSKKSMHIYAQFE